MKDVELYDVVDGEIVDELCESCLARPGALMEDPFASDVNDDHTLHVLCEPCAQERADDI